MSITNLTRKYCNYKALLFLLEFSAVSSLLLISAESDAAEWVLTPTLRTDLIFTDNVRLAPTSGSKEADFITRITPGIESSFISRRFTSDVTYRLNNIIFARNADRSRSLHRLRARNTVEVVRNLFYFDGNVSMRQQNQSILAPQGDDANLTGNLRNIRQYKASPYIRKRFGNFATTEVRYARVWNDSDARNSFFNSRTNVYNASLLSGPSSERFHWGLNYVRQDIEFTLRPDPVRIETEIANVRYDLTRKFAVTGTGGYENNNFGSGLGGQRPKGTRWSAGFVWVPNVRTRIQASFGQRFFGDTYAFDLGYSNKYIGASAVYNERIRSARNFVNLGAGATTAVLTSLFTGQAPPGTDPALIAQQVQLFIAELGLPPSLAFAQSFLTNRFFLQKRFESAIALKGKKNTLLFRVFHRTRRPLDSQPGLDIFAGTFQQSNIRSHGGNITWSLRLSRLSRVNVGGLWIRRSFPNLSRKDTFRIYTISYNRQLSRTIFGQIRYRRMERTSNASNAAFDENRFIASLNMRF